VTDVVAGGPPPIRVGLGYDSHAFGEGEGCLLGGILFSDAPPLRGHSDADAVAHAVTDALLGAVADGDIGTHYPPSDDRWKGADSMALLSEVVGRLHARGWAVGNLDITVICQRPRIGPRAGEVRARLSAVLGVSPDAVSLKGKTNEGMGWEGREEGIGVHAIALVYRATGVASR
jgi:2-C-methyl-D-erythritol 2,4-cyclodiphosphate synthase